MGKTIAQLAIDGDKELKKVLQALPDMMHKKVAKWALPRANKPIRVAMKAKAPVRKKGKSEATRDANNKLLFKRPGQIKRAIRSVTRIYPKGKVKQRGRAVVVVLTGPEAKGQWSMAP